MDIYFPNSDLHWINELERLELNGEIDMQSICRNALADEVCKRFRLVNNDQ